mmetsp:Transcript_5069/g.18441  ORF Transcript_5069/g.18441 Transcript_5069/m.18441 type:complete len:397 (+) Transcript_5069:119-1309(+)
MHEKHLRAVIRLALLWLTGQVHAANSQPGLDAEGERMGTHQHTLSQNGTLNSMSLQAKYQHWQRRDVPDFLKDLPSWEEQQHEQHPLDSLDLRGPFVYSQEEEQALERSLAVDEGVWNASRGGIGGRPRPRYCVLQETWRERQHPDVDFSAAGFRTALHGAVHKGHLRDFLVYDRYQAPRGHDVLTGAPLRSDLASSYSCPILRTYSDPDWICALKLQGGQRNGVLKTDMAFKDVRTMRFTSSSLLDSASPRAIPDFDGVFFQRGPSFPYCHEGSCDCDRVFQEHSGHFPDVCNVRKLLKSLEPYRETYARQQITVAFSLFDRPWFTATSEPVHGANGLIETESQLPSQMVQSNWFGRIFYEGKRDRLPGFFPVWWRQGDRSDSVQSRTCVSSILV